MNDGNDVFRVEIVNAAANVSLSPLHSVFRLIHNNTGCLLNSHDKQLPLWSGIFAVSYLSSPLFCLMFKKFYSKFSDSGAIGDIIYIVFKQPYTTTVLDAVFIIS